MSYQVLARKWRPATFKQMVGQEHVLQALINALDSDRLHHAYLFSGTRGVGKTTIARIFAKSLNCDQGIGSEPCGVCASCVEIDEGRSVDLIEIDAASRTGVEDMRELLDNVQYAPTSGRFKVYLIDEVHMLSKHSFNALLKTLEEPPPHVKFLLATTDPQKVPVTVLSRCLQFNLKRMSRAQIMSQLQFLVEQEQIDAESAALIQLARAADGSMRDALSLLDQAIAHGGGAVPLAAVDSMLGAISRDYLVKIFASLLQRDAVELLRETRAIIDNNPDYQRVCGEMIAMLQQIAVYQKAPGQLLDDDLGEEILQHYASQWSAEEIQLFYQILLQGRQDLLICPDEAAGFEMLMLRLLAFAPDIDPVDLKKKPEVIPRTEAPAATNAAIEQSPAPVATVPEVPAGPNPELEEQDVAADAALPDNDIKRVAATALCQSGEAAIVLLPGSEEGPVSATKNDASELDWSSLAYDLGLEGLAQEIAANSVLVAWQDSRFSLNLAPEIYELRNSMLEDEISRALEQKLGVSLKLELVSSQNLAQDTPLQARIKRLQRERLDAIEAIRQEKLVKKLQQAFSVELDEASVSRIED